MKWAIVSGGSRGLGNAVCLELKQQGWQILELSRSAPHAHSVVCDFSDFASVKLAMESVWALCRAKETAELLVINNAASLEPIGPLASLSEEEMQRHWNANVVGPSWWLGQILQKFEDCPVAKTMIQISSGAAVKAYPGWSMYGSSKAAMEALFRTLVVEQAGKAKPFKFGIFDPGVMDTQMQEIIRECTLEEFPQVKRFIGIKESGNLREPKTVACALLRWYNKGFESGVRASAQDWLS